MDSVDFVVVEVLILFVSYDIWEALSINSDLSGVNLSIQPLEEMVTLIEPSLAILQLFL